MHILKMVSGDTGPPIDFKIKSGSQKKDLTGCTVDFFIKAPDGSQANTGHTLCTITDVTNGLARYDFEAGDTDQVGDNFCDVQVTNQDASIQTEYKQTKIIIRDENEV